MAEIWVFSFMVTTADHVLPKILTRLWAQPHPQADRLVYKFIYEKKVSDYHYGRKDPLTAILDWSVVTHCQILIFPSRSLVIYRSVVGTCEALQDTGLSCTDLYINGIGHCLWPAVKPFVPCHAVAAILRSEKRELPFLPHCQWK